uniref:Uncharacterized protein n=1 Tax=Arundo donax TaxID=35708 RepID=A0A0A9D6D7_ARUDO
MDVDFCCEELKPVPAMIHGAWTSLVSLWGQRESSRGRGAAIAASNHCELWAAV